MTESLFVNADWSALVPAGSPEAAFGITPKDAKRRGLLPLDQGEQLEQPEMLATANLAAAEPEADAAQAEDASAPEPEPAAEAAEAKEADKPADKAESKPANKAAHKPASKTAKGTP